MSGIAIESPGKTKAMMSLAFNTSPDVSHTPVQLMSIIVHKHLNA